MFFCSAMIVPLFKILDVLLFHMICSTVPPSDGVLFHHNVLIFNHLRSTVQPWLFHCYTIRCCTVPQSDVRLFNHGRLTLPPSDFLFFHHDCSTVPPLNVILFDNEMFYCSTITCSTCLLLVVPQFHHDCSCFPPLDVVLFKHLFSTLSPSGISLFHHEMSYCSTTIVPLFLHLFSTDSPSDRLLFHHQMFHCSTIRCFTVAPSGVVPFRHDCFTVPT